MTTFSTYAIATFSDGNVVTVTSAENMFSGLPITFSGSTFGNITANATYYIGNITYGYPTSNITLTSLPGGAVYALANGSGNMTGTFSQGGQQIIPTVPPGEPLNQAFDAINLNFDQIWAAGPVGSNIKIAQNTIYSLDTNGNLVLNPNGIGNVIANAHVIPDQDRARNLGAPTLRWNTIYAQTFNGNITGNIQIGGYNTQVQFNDGGSLGGSFGFVFDKASNSVVIAGPLTAGDVFTAGQVSATGNGTFNNVLANGVVSASGNIQAGNLRTTGRISATGNIYSNANVTGRNVYSGGDISAAGTGYFGNITTYNTITATDISATGNMYSGNVLTNGIVSSFGNAIHRNLFTTGFVSAGSNVVAENFVTLGQITAAGNITGGNILFGSGMVSGTGNIFTNVLTANTFVTSALSITGNITGGNLLTSGLISATGNITSAANIAGANLLTTGQISAAANVVAANLLTTGLISATGTITGGNIQTTGNAIAGNVLTPGIVSSGSGVYGDIYTTMIDSGESAAILVVSEVNMLSDLTVGQSLYVDNNISAVGNISANYYFGNGSQLTGIVADVANANSLQGNTLANNVIFSNLTTLGNLVSLTVDGNASANNFLFGNGIISGTGNIYADKIFANISGNIDAAGNLYEIQFNTTGDLLGASPAFTFDNTANLLYVGGNISALGNVTVGQDLSVVGNIYGNVIAQIPASANIIYVAKNGSDSNTGTINSPFATIKHAMSVATANTSVHVAPGTYTEANPITIPPNVALIGDNLRSVSVVPQTPAGDMFYMTNGTYVWGITIRNYTGNGFSYDPATPTQNVFVSPYIQNITSFTTTGTAVKIDGSLTSASSTKAMIVGFFTIINRAGKGVHIINEGYSQLVNIYTIACDIGILVESGGFCTLNGSDCSIGNFGLIANGVGSLQTTGSTVGYSTQGLFTVGSLSNGRPWVNTVMKIAGDPAYYTIDDIVPINATTSEIYVQQTYTGNLAPGTSVEFYVRSAIIASAHTFEYVGAGTNPATALPQYGGIPIEANEVKQLNGGVVTFTSTDQKGNFKVGQGFTINQAQGTITGTYFYKSLFAQMTPYILAITPD